MSYISVKCKTESRVQMSPIKKRYEHLLKYRFTLTIYHWGREQISKSWENKFTAWKKLMCNETCVPNKISHVVYLKIISDENSIHIFIFCVRKFTSLPPTGPTVHESSHVKWKASRKGYQKKMFAVLNDI